MNTLQDKLNFSKEEFQRGIRRLVKKENLFKTWFSRAKIEELNDGSLLMTVPSDLALDWIKRRYWESIEEMVSQQWDTKIELVTGNSSPVVELEDVIPADEPKLKAKKLEAINRSGFDFKDFVPGAENQLAYVAAKAVGKKMSYHSPLTIVGDHGMGKTHLASAMAEEWPENQVLQWHAEEFSNAYIQAIKDSNLEEFRARMRSRALVVIEDIDFFLEGNKKKTIEELMNSLKVLKRDCRHIVVTSSQPVYKFEEVCPRLSHFLLTGLKVKLQAPSPESIKEIIGNYIKKHSFKLAPKSKSFIESIPFNNPRELLGAMQQVSAYSILNNEPLPLSVVKDILSDHIRTSVSVSSGEELDLHGIASVVTKSFGVQLQKLVSPTRERHVSFARHVAMSLSYENHFTLKEIGQFYGGRLHQSVLFGTKKVQEKLKKDLDFQKSYRKLQAELKLMVK